MEALYKLKVKDLDLKIVKFQVSKLLFLKIVIVCLTD